MDVVAITSDSIPAPVGPFSPALRVGDWVFLSGQGGFDPKTGRLVGAGHAGRDYRRRRARSRRRLEAAEKRIGTAFFREKEASRQGGHSP